MGVVIYVLHDLSMFIVIPISAVAYIVAVLLTNALTSEERALLAGLLRRLSNRIGFARA
jgi:hypothetical protein